MPDINMDVSAVVKRRDSALQSQFDDVIERHAVKSGTLYREWVSGKEFLDAEKTAQYIEVFGALEFLDYISQAFLQLGYLGIVPALGTNEDRKVVVLIVNRTS